MKGTHEEQVKAEARNQAEKDKAQREVNEAEEKRIAVENEPAIEQEKENKKFIEVCVREQHEAEIAEATKKAAASAKAEKEEQEVQFVTKAPPSPPTPPPPSTPSLPPNPPQTPEEIEKFKKEQEIAKKKQEIAIKEQEEATKKAAAKAKAAEERKKRGIKDMCNTKFNPSTEHVDCSGLISSTPTIKVYDLIKWDAYKGELNPASKPTPIKNNTFEILKYLTAIPKCWSYLDQCIPGIEHFTPAEAALTKSKDGSDPDAIPNLGLAPILERFGIMDMMDEKLNSFTLASLLPDKMKAMGPMLEDIVGPKKLYDLNVKPLLENTNALWGDRLFDQVCGFFPGMLPPIAPRDPDSKYGPHILVPRLPHLPKTLRFPIGDLTLTDEGGIHISKQMFNMLISLGPMLPG